LAVPQAGNLRDRLVGESNDAIPFVLGLYPEADSQQLHSLVRNE
jgi:ribosome-associated protein